MQSVIRVYNRDGKPVTHKRVDISISEFLAGGMAHGFTDDSGIANISHASEGPAKIYINGSKVGDFVAPGNAKVVV